MPAFTVKGKVFLPFVDLCKQDAVQVKLGGYLFFLFLRPFQVKRKDDPALFNAANFVRVILSQCVKIADQEAKEKQVLNYFFHGNSPFVSCNPNSFLAKLIQTMPCSMKLKPSMPSIFVP